MILEGVVSNVANFGAFVDIGVHQDGLVHISALSHRFVKDPREVVKARDVVKVKVLEVDAARKRIALTMRLDDDLRDVASTPTASNPGRGRRDGLAAKASGGKNGSGPAPTAAAAPRLGTLGELLLAAQKGKA